MENIKKLLVDTSNCNSFIAINDLVAYFSEFGKIYAISEVKKGKVYVVICDSETCHNVLKSEHFDFKIVEERSIMKKPKFFITNCAKLDNVSDQISLTLLRKVANKYGKLYGAKLEEFYYPNTRRVAFIFFYYSRSLKNFLKNVSINLFQTNYPIYSPTDLDIYLINLLNNYSTQFIPPNIKDQSLPSRKNDTSPPNIEQCKPWDQEEIRRPLQSAELEETERRPIQPNNLHPMNGVSFDFKKPSRMWIQIHKLNETFKYVEETHDKNTRNLHFRPIKRVEVGSVSIYDVKTKNGTFLLNTNFEFIDTDY